MLVKVSVEGTPRRRWEDNIKIDLRDIGWGDLHRVHLAQDWDRWRVLVNTVVNLQFSQKARNFLSS
jgi:hypothetical protein